MKITKKPDHAAAMYQDLIELEREGHTHTLVDRYVASAGDKDFRDLIKEMAFFEAIFDSVKELSLAKR